MRFASANLIIALYFALFGSAGVASGQSLDAGIGDVAGPDRPRPDAVAAEVPDTAQEGQEDPEERERRELGDAIAALDALLEGQQVDADATQLCGVDPVDSDAVPIRLLELRAHLAEAEGALAADRAAAHRSEHRDDPDGAREGPDAPTPDGEDPPSESPDDTPGAAEPVQAAEPPPPSLFELRVTHDQRIIAFLVEPLDRRATAVAHDAESRRLAQELTSAVAQAAEAARVEAEARGAEERALAEAAQVSAAAARELVSERARAEALRGQLAQATGVQAQDRQRLARMGQSWSALASEIDVVVTHGEPTPEVADALYDRSVVALGQSRGSFDRAVTAIDAPVGYPVFELALDPAAPRYQSHPAEREHLLRVVQEVGETHARIAIAERDFRWTRAKALASHVSTLDAARQQLLPRTSEAKRNRLLSLGPEGIDQLRQEAYHLGLMTRWYLRTRPATLRDLPSWFAGKLAHSASRWVLIQLFLLFLLVTLLVARRERVTHWVHEALVDAADTPEAVALAEQWSRAVFAVAVPLLALLGTYAGFALARSIADPPELELARSIMLALTWFGLVISTIHYAIVGVTRAHRANISPAFSRRILKSVRLVAGYALFAVILTIIDRQLIGRGYIQELVIEFAWIGAVPIGILIIRRWRVEITDTFIARYPGASMSRGLARARGRFWDILLLVPAGLRLMAAGLTVLVEDTALRFDRIRRALAYLFRRRLERTAETIGRGTADASELPIVLRRAFGPGDLSEETKVARFSGLDEVLEAVSAWKAGGVGMSLALVGPVGVGKGAWMAELLRRAQEQESEDDPTAQDAKESKESKESKDAPEAAPTFEAVEATLDDSLEDERAVCIALSKAFDLEPAHEDVESLVTVLSEMKPRLVLLNHCQNLHLRCVGGFAGVRAFAGIIRRTSQRFIWVSSFSSYSFQHLSYVAGGARSLFTRIEHLDGWTEAELGELIDQRMKRAGVAASFEDLLPPKVRGAEREAELVRTRERYLRLLWDYSDGLPRVALYYWLRSLVPIAEDTVSVRLFDAPHADDLEHIGATSRFLLHAVISHENLSIAEAVRVLAMPLDELTSLFEMLRLQGYLSRSVDRYRVTTRWDRAVVSYLRRKHLLYS